MAGDIIYKYELTNGSTYIGRDRVGKYKRAIDHLNNALAVACSGTKYDGIFVPAFIQYNKGFNITSPQVWERTWSQIIRGHIENDSSLGERLLTAMDFDITNLTESYNQETETEFQVNNIKTEYKQNKHLSPFDLGILRWSYFSATQFCNSIQITHSLKQDTTVQTSLTNVLNKVFVGALKDPTKFTEFLVTAQYFSDPHTAGSLLNREAGDYTNYISFLQNHTGWSIKNFLSDAQLKKEGYDSFIKICNQQFNKQNKRIEMKSVPITSTETIVKIPAQDLMQEIIQSAWTAKPPWIVDTTNMFATVLKNIKVNTSIIHQQLSGVQTNYNDIQIFLKLKQDFLKTINKARTEEIKELNSFIILNDTKRMNVFKATTLASDQQSPIIKEFAQFIRSAKNNINK